MGGAVIEEMVSTTLLLAGQKLIVVEYGHLVITAENEWEGWRVAVIVAMTLEVVRNNFQRVAEDMEATVRRTAYSIAIYDSTDFACGVLDAEPNLLAGSLGTPIFVTILPTAVRAVYQFIGKENLEAEDVVIC